MFLKVLYLTPSHTGMYFSYCIHSICEKIYKALSKIVFILHPLFTWNSSAALQERISPRINYNTLWVRIVIESCICRKFLILKWDFSTNLCCTSSHNVRKILTSTPYIIYLIRDIITNDFLCQFNKLKSMKVNQKNSMES